MTKPGTPPSFALYRIATAFYASRALFVIAELGVPDQLADGAKSAAELATATDANPDALRRVLRLATAHGLLEEDFDGRFSLTPIGAALKSGPGSSRSSVRLFAGDSQWKVWGDLLESVRTGESAFQRVHGEESFAYFATRPEQGAVFDEAMRSFTQHIARAVGQTYDFSDRARVLDVGGGSGAMIAGLLEMHPHLSGAVFDLPRLEAAAREQLAPLGERADFVGGDFFEAVPEGYDLYVLKHVIHDWGDDDAAKILGRVREAIGDTDAPMVLVEGLYPPRVEASPEHRGATGNDCNMLVATGGRQRSEAEMRALLERAGLALERVVSTAMTPMIVARPSR